MTALLTELKTRARLKLNALRRNASADTETASTARLRDCLNRVSRDVGFSHWDHARRVLGGLAGTGDDMGSFWHAPGCLSLLNQWCASHEQARQLQRADPGSFVLPYRRQFMLVHDDFIRELALDPAEPAWSVVRRDLVQGYGSSAWHTLALHRLKAAQTTFNR